MSVEVRRATADDLEQWNRLVKQSPKGTVFHRLEFLSTIEEHTGSTLHHLVGYKGQEPVGAFPLYGLNKGPVRAAFSPPPHLGVPYLGPILFNYRKLKQRKYESLNVRFVEGCLDWLERERRSNYLRVLTAPRYDDPRPFQWNEFDIQPRYTYHVDLSDGIDSVLERFGRDARKSIRNTDADAYSIDRPGPEALDYVLERINARYSDEDERTLDPAYVESLYERLPDDAVRLYVGRVDGERVSGRITLRHGDTITLWQGSPKPDDGVDVPINDLLNWQSIKDGIEDGFTRCDVVGANTRRICRYKSKFNPTLSVYYEVEHGTKTMNAVSNLYRKFV